jgi:tetratricopeptide (TPR) repeat protein
MSSGDNNNPKQPNNLPAVSSSSLRVLGNQVQVLDDVLKERDREFWLSKGIMNKSQGQWAQAKYCAERALLISPNFSKAHILRAISCCHISEDTSWHQNIISFFTSDYVVNSVMGRGDVIYNEEWQELAASIPYPSSIEEFLNKQNTFLAYSFCHYQAGGWFYGSRDWLVSEIEKFVVYADPNTQSWLYLVLSLFYIASRHQQYEYKECLTHADDYLSRALSTTPSFVAAHYVKAAYGIDFENTLKKIFEVGVNISEADLFFHICNGLDDPEEADSTGICHYLLDDNKRIGQSWLTAYSKAIHLNKANALRISTIKLKQANLNFVMGFVDEALSKHE